MILGPKNFRQSASTNQSTEKIPSVQVIDVWKKTVDVQQHFNDIALRIRNYALTLFTAIIGGIALLEKDKIKIFIIHSNVSASFILTLVGLFVLSGFCYMDRYWYHNLLVGAVKQASFIEKKYAKDFPEIGLGLAISEASPHTILWKWQIHSKHKFWIFYGLLAVPLFLFAIIMFPTISNSGQRDNKNSIRVVKSVDSVFIHNVNSDKNTRIKHKDTTIVILDSSFQDK